MSYLLDTNVLSELRRKTPNAGVVEWFARRPASTLFLSVLTLGELRKGVEGMADADRRTALLDWLEAELPIFFTGRILSVDVQVADRWGRLMAAAKRPVPAIDSLLAATAAHHGLSLVTRNVRDFVDSGLDVINPWTD
ncbi:recombinase [Rugosibacter aromaticivorans]|uniref:Ribonuclease VapC n=1 Tax=Rugosibacter aromaticivorans TaxID=1565605 RepID=A0A0C5JBE2_9PROT|nr:type II toxin-antitoxin system VapC family toxin [Rugosibacter aromaticivorans]AJP49113.1 recombinase [Rugosibacter aromaticivorans]TBR13090.1 MAG: type II toxin-antitoxin system VapC family toxin [Rugosibacter sp.]